MSFKILVIDDEPNLEPLMQQIFRQQIRQQELDFIFATNGLDGWEKLLGYPEISLILTDINMPKMDGLTLLTQIKASHEQFNPALETVVISAYDDMTNVRKAMNLGAFDFLTKPLNMGDLRTTVQKARAHITLRQEQFQQKQQAEQALHQLNSELEQRVQSRTTELSVMNEELNAFTRTVANDLKIPLSTLLGYADYLVNFCPSISASEMLELLKQVQESGYRALYIIDELLLLASVQREQFEAMPLDMASIVTQAQQRLYPLIEQTQAKIYIPDSWPIPEGHGVWVEEVWVNYLSNSLKYGGRPPEITIGSAVQADGMVRCWVRDNGAGLSAAKQASLFAEFTRLDPSHIQQGEQGLGLSVVKRIIEKLGGQVGLVSAPGQGSEFYFTLPNAEK